VAYSGLYALISQVWYLPVNSQFTYDTNYVRAGGVPIVIWATNLASSYKLPLIPVISITGISPLSV